jgi:DNA anti-recombination protein RmuC
MEQILAFSLGVFTVVAVAAVVNSFKVRKTISEVVEDVENAHDAIDNLATDLSDDIKQAEEDFDYRLKDLEKDLRGEIDEIYKIIDSRIDKLDFRIDTKFNDNTAFVDKLYTNIRELQNIFREVKQTDSKSVKDK